jgi:hypothetical protein
MTLKARVKAGRLVVDEPTDLPEGTEVELLALDPGDWLDDEDRAALHKALLDSEEDVKAGRLIDADIVLRELGPVEAATRQFHLYRTPARRSRESVVARDPRSSGVLR